jgi:hypothetical protein
MTLDVDALAQEIRRVDGSNDLGAGALAEALMPFLSTLAPSAAASERLFDQNHPMADGEERMTAAEDVLAWLVIEKCGCPDDTPITPKEASDTIAGMIDHLRKYEDTALASPSAEAAQSVAKDIITDGENVWPVRLNLRDTTLYDDMGGGGQRIYTTAGRGYKKREYVRADAALSQGELREALTGIKRYGLMFMNGTPYIGEKATGRYVNYNDVAALSQPQGELREALADLVSWFDGGPSSYGPWIIKAGPYGADEAVEAARAALAGRTAG